MTLLLVMLHTGTMFSVIVYFWRQWRETYFQNMADIKKSVGLVVLATSLTGLIGEALIVVIEKVYFRGVPHAQIEDLFSHLEFVAPALALVGILIVVADATGRGKSTRDLPIRRELNVREASVIGSVQGLCLPFRGFSRSGATISVAILLGVAKSRGEMFSFALAVVPTPVVVGRELMRVVHAERATGTAILASAGRASMGNSRRFKVSRKRVEVNCVPLSVVRVALASQLPCGKRASTACSTASRASSFSQA